MITFRKHTKNIFPNRRAVTNPAIIRSYRTKELIIYREEEVEGDFSLVFPKDAREHLFLRSLCHQLDKFAPAEGNGILVRSDLLPPI